MDLISGNYARVSLQGKDFDLVRWMKRLCLRGLVRVLKKL